MWQIQQFTQYFSVPECGPLLLTVSVLTLTLILFGDSTIRISAFTLTLSVLFCIIGFWQVHNLLSRPDIGISTFVFYLASAAINGCGFATWIMFREATYVTARKGDEAYIVPEPKDRAKEKSFRKNVTIPAELLDLQAPHHEWLEPVPHPSAHKKLAGETA